MILALGLAAGGTIVDVEEAALVILGLAFRVLGITTEEVVDNGEAIEVMVSALRFLGVSTREGTVATVDEEVEVEVTALLEDIATSAGKVGTVDEQGLTSYVSTDKRQTKVLQYF